MFITDNSVKMQRAKDFCVKNQLPVTITQAPSIMKNSVKDIVQIEFSRQKLEHSNCYKLQTHSAVKPVLIDDLLYKYLPLQPIGELQYQVARVKAVIKLSKATL